MNNNIKVSVILPVYNVEEYLVQCLDSLINQTLKEIEIICVDDGSKDNSLEILHQYEKKDSRIKVLTQKNQFAGVARNNGMKVASGEYYVFLDSDDFFEKDLLEKEYKQCKEYDADVCLCNADKYDISSNEFLPASGLLNLNNIDNQPFNLDSVENLFGVTAPNPWTKMFSSRFIQKHNLEFQNLQRTNDAYFVLSAIALAERIVAVDEILVHYRVGQKTNLQATKVKTPTSFCVALSSIKDKLIQENIYDKAEKHSLTLL